MIEELKILPFRLASAIVINSIIGIPIFVIIFYYGLACGLGGVYYVGDHLSYLLKILFFVILFIIYNSYRYKKVKKKELKYDIFLFIISSLFVVAFPIIYYFLKIGR